MVPVMSASGTVAVTRISARPRGGAGGALSSHILPCHDLSSQRRVFRTRPPPPLPARRAVAGPSPRFGGAGGGRRASSARRVLANDVSEDIDGIEFDDRYTWRVGGPNDIPCKHLVDVYRGAEPLRTSPNPFCTKSSCPLPGVTDAPRTSLKLNKVFVSPDDRVLLKSMAFGCVTR